MPTLASSFGFVWKIIGMQEARAMAEDAIRAYLESLREDGLASSVD